MTNGKSNLKLVIVYDAGKNQYEVSTHNLTPEEADRLILEWNQHLIEGCRLLAITQRRRHQTVNPQECRACRETVSREAHLEPAPKFRRKSNDASKAD